MQSSLIYGRHTVIIERKKLHILKLKVHGHDSIKVSHNWTSHFLCWIHGRNYFFFVLIQFCYIILYIVAGDPHYLFPHLEFHNFDICRLFIERKCFDRDRNVK